MYLYGRSIPGYYLVALLGIILASLVAIRAAGGPVRRMLPYVDLAFLGAAFLLLETRAITGFALLFGTTWVVNAIVFAGVLLVVLAAVEVTRHWSTPPLRLLYLALAGTLLLAGLVPPDLLLQLPLVPRALTAVLVAFLPVFVANLIFAKRFNDTADATSAFAANLLGAIVGGCLEYLSLVVGYQMLIALAAALYLAALLSSPRTSQLATTS